MESPSFPLLTIITRDNIQQNIDFASRHPSQCNNTWMPSSSFVDINQSATLHLLILHTIAVAIHNHGIPIISIVDNHHP